ncbi:MAG: arsenate reductase (glutaredoxin) [Brumimicrobium sp.]|nr:arsenate reductase (glutaredoxin) [Brumimicrobium sp.]MCO5267788.1 arsenate reductase (glutaredoxin) [Brumimicrobium sp.]
MKVFHNPRCSKSRCALDILDEKQIDYEVVKYLEEGPSKEDIKDVLKKLGLPAEDIVRKGEQVYKDNFKGKKLTEEQWIDAMVKYPILIERPILINGDKAVIGRPPERVLEIL